MPLNPAERTLSSTELLPRVLHEFAQPLSALACNVELTLMEDADVARYHDALEHALTITQRLSERVAYFRNLHGALEPCDCSTPVDSARAMAGAVEAVRELATSIGTDLELRADSVPLHGNQEKLRTAVVRLFDGMFQSGTPARVRLTCAGKQVAEVEIHTMGKQKQTVSPRAWELVRAGLTSMGMELQIRECATEIEATIAACLYPLKQATLLE